MHYLMEMLRLIWLNLSGISTDKKGRQTPNSLYWKYMDWMLFSSGNIEFAGVFSSLSYPVYSAIWELKKYKKLANIKILNTCKTKTDRHKMVSPDRRPCHNYIYIHRPLQLHVGQVIELFETFSLTLSSGCSPGLFSFPSVKMGLLTIVLSEAWIFTAFCNVFSAMFA